VKYMKFLAVFAALAAVLSASSCDMDNHRSFAFHLQGTWDPNTAPICCPSKLKIEFDRITIESHSGPCSWWCLFRDLPRNHALSGFSEGTRINRNRSGQIFIDAGGLRPPISYTHYYTADGLPLLHFYHSTGSTTFGRRSLTHSPKP